MDHGVFLHSVVACCGQRVDSLLANSLSSIYRDLDKWASVQVILSMAPALHTRIIAQLCEMLPNLFSPIYCSFLIDVYRPEKVDISMGVSFACGHRPLVATTVRSGEFDPARVCRWWLKCGVEYTRG